MRYNSAMSRLTILLFIMMTTAAVSAAEPRKLPGLPAPEFRVAEVFDNRLEMWIELYATKDPNVVDYATARKVLHVIMNHDGTPGYELAPHPLFIWWGRALWKDIEEDGINGNEVIQEDNVIFHWILTLFRQAHPYRTDITLTLGDLPPLNRSRFYVRK